MELVYGELLIAAGVLLFFIVLIGARNPKSPVWASNFLLENFHPIVIILTWFFGIYLGIKDCPPLLKVNSAPLKSSFYRLSPRLLYTW